MRLLPWYILGADGSLRPINTVLDDQLCTKQMTYAIIAYEGGCVACPTHDPKDPAPADGQWPGHDSYSQAIIALTLPRTKGSELPQNTPSTCSSQRTAPSPSRKQ